MTAFIFQTLLLSALAFILGLLLGRFLKRFFCKDRTYSERVEKYVTRTESVDSNHDAGTSNVAKAAAAAVVAGGAAVATKIMTDNKEESAEHHEADDRSISVEAETPATNENIQVDDTNIEDVVKESVDVVEVAKTNLLGDLDHNDVEIATDSDIEDVASAVEAKADESISVETEDSSLLDTVKGTVAMAGAGLAAKVGADALSEDDVAEAALTTDELSEELEGTVTEAQDSIILDSTEEVEAGLPTADVEVAVEELETTDVADIDTPEADSVSVDSPVAEESIASEDDLPETTDITEAVSEELDEAEAGLANIEVEKIADIGSPEADNVSEEMPIAEEGEKLKEEEGSSILDTLKATAAVAGAGIAAKVGADALSSDEAETVDTDTEVSDVEAVIADTDIPVDIDGAEDEAVDKTDNVAEEMSIAEEGGKLKEEDDSSILDALKTTAAVAGAGIAVKVGADALSSDEAETVDTDIEVGDIEDVIADTDIEVGDIEDVIADTDIEVGDIEDVIADTDMSVDVDGAETEVVDIDSSIDESTDDKAAAAEADTSSEMAADEEVSADSEAIDNSETTVDAKEVEADDSTDEGELANSDAADNSEDTDTIIVEDADAADEVDSSTDTEQYAEAETADESVDEEVATDGEADTETASTEEESTDDNQVADADTSDDTEVDSSDEGVSLGSVAKGSAALAAAGLAATVVSKADDSTTTEDVTNEGDDDETEATEESAETGKKHALIKEMLEMQAKFIADEQAGNFNAEDYYIGEGKAYRQRYHELAAEVRELASKEANFWK